MFDPGINAHSILTEIVAHLILAAAADAALASLASSVATAVSWTTEFMQRHQPLPRDPLPDPIAVFEAIRGNNS